MSSEDRPDSYDEEEWASLSEEEREDRIHSQYMHDHPGTPYSDEAMAADLERVTEEDTSASSLHLWYLWIKWVKSHKQDQDN